MYRQTIDEKEEKIRTVRETLEGDLSVAAGYIFGSFGTERFNEDSDIDIGVLYLEEAPEPFSADYLDLKGRLEDSLRREVDLVVLNAVSPVLCMQVLKYGQKVFVRNPRAADDFFVKTVERYSDLRVVRRPIEEHILDNGIYG